MILRKSLLNFFVTCLLLLSRPCFADLCFKTFEQDTTDASAIFVGKVIHIEQNSFFADGRSRSIVTFELIESFKGVRTWESYLSLITPFPGQYGNNYPIDSTFLVFAYASDKIFSPIWTNECSLTDLISESKVNYERLGNPRKHHPDKMLLLHFRNHSIRKDSVLALRDSLQNTQDEYEKGKFTIRSLKFVMAILVIVILLFGFVLLRILNPGT